MDRKEEDEPGTEKDKRSTVDVSGSVQIVQVSANEYMRRGSRHETARGEEVRLLRDSSRRSV